MAYEHNKKRTKIVPAIRRGLILGDANSLKAIDVDRLVEALELASSIYEASAEECLRLSERAQSRINRVHQTAAFDLMASDMRFRMDTATSHANFFRGAMEVMTARKGGELSKKLKAAGGAQ